MKIICFFKLFSWLELSDLKNIFSVLKVLYAILFCFLAKPV